MLSVQLLFADFLCQIKFLVKEHLNHFSFSFHRKLIFFHKENVLLISVFLLVTALTLLLADLYQSWTWEQWVGVMWPLSFLDKCSFLGKSRNRNTYRGHSGASQQRQKRLSKGFYFAKYKYLNIFYPLNIDLLFWAAKVHKSTHVLLHEHTQRSSLSHAAEAISIYPSH